MRPITLLTDYGLGDEFVGVCHAVIARIAPESRVIDLSHGIPRHGVLQGALVLERSLPYAPPGVHVVVVDPEVGAARRAIALRTVEEDRHLVGPDNGVLLPAAERFGGVAEVVEISESPWRLEPVSATFHGRDIFAPVGARLATGELLAGGGRPLDPDELVPLDLPRPVVRAGELQAVAVGVDGFGNVSLLAAHGDLAATGFRLGQPLVVRAGVASLPASYGRTFADVGAGAALVYEDAARHVAVAINTGDAAAALGGLRAGARVTVAAVPDP